MSPALSAQTAPQPAAKSLSSFVVGQDDAGHWIAVETHGLGGGYFRSRGDAIRYALGETIGRPEAVTLSADRIAIRM